MKNLKKFLVLLLAAVMVFSLVACQPNDGNEGGKGGSNGPDERGENAIERGVGLTAEQLENYCVEFTVTRPQSVLNKDNKYVEEIKPFSAREVSFEGYRHSTTMLLENPFYTVRDNSCFTYTDQDDYRGWFAAHKQYLGDERSEENITVIGEEKVAGFDTKHYEFKMGIYDIHFWVCEEYDLTIKYEYKEKDFSKTPVEFVLKKSLEVTKLEFGTMTHEDFYACPTPTPQPLPEEG